MQPWNQTKAALWMAAAAAAEEEEEEEEEEKGIWEEVTAATGQHFPLTISEQPDTAL